MSREEDTACAGSPGTARIDRWLFGVRLFKSRSLAAQAVNGGKVHVNGARVRASHSVKPGDRVSFNRDAVDFECHVAAIPARRGPAKEAVTCYAETDSSRVRREEHAQRMRLASAMAPRLRPEERPNKHDRKELRRLRGRG
ncbi:MAG TPA: RNA-binding S4 domain-containing protein [Steroidobacteraceae bacterium]|jgi:ribosome-associated heat shock protein Hsp15|nr:RNA-binding S4 domain-containing protein [Steroidobacteraceae bacterium]